jgi:hypothetical protein
VPTIAELLSLKSNPFEHYTAETEPHISEYAVRPPYLQAIVARALAHTTFILFGDRGAGKSATRLTLFNEIWARKPSDDRPLVVNFVDFTAALPSLRKGAVSEDELRGYLRCRAAANLSLSRTPAITLPSFLETFTRLQNGRLLWRPRSWLRYSPAQP